MSFTIEFDDKRQTEMIHDSYKNINEASSLGMSFVDFLSLENDFYESNHVYFKLNDDPDERINKDSRLFSRMKEFIDLCIKDNSLYNTENFMFFLYLEGLSVPEHHLNYLIDPNNPVERLVNPHIKITPFEAAIRGFDKSDKSENAITNIYTCDSIEDVCMASLYHLIKLKLIIKKCNNCGKYFVPLLRSDAIYCDRISPFNPSKTCKEDGAQRTFEEKLKMNDAEKLHRSIYQAKQMRVRRNPDDASCKENFQKWKTDVAKWKSNIKKGKRTSEEFIQWLNKSKKK